MSFLGELKRRNVFRVALAYIVGAWVLLQIVDFVLDAISAPNWILQVFILAAAVGLPVATIVSWVFEMTPEGIKRESEIDRSQSIVQQTGRKLDRVTIGFLALAVVILLADRFINTDEVDPVGGRSAAESAQITESRTERAAAGSGTADATAGGLSAAESAGISGSRAERASTEKSIAVLPFVNMSADPEQEFFSDGISEEILNMLVRLPELKVAGRTSSFSFKGQNANIQEIGQKLHVSHILEGSVRKAGDRVRITAQLIQVDDGFHLWSESFDRELTDIFAVQDEIAQAIAAALTVQLSLNEGNQVPASSTTQNIAAYERYLQGRDLVTRRADFPRAIQLLTEANEMAPEFAPAWAINAQAHNLSFYYQRDMDRAQALADSERLAEQALAIDPNLASAHSALGDMYRDTGRWIQAQQSYQRALQINPDEVEANEQWAQSLWRAGLLRESAEFSARAVELDPLSWLNLTVDGAVSNLLGENERAWDQWQRAAELSNYASDYQLRTGVNMAISDGNLARAGEIMGMMLSSDLPEAGIETLKQLIPLLDQPEPALIFIQETLARGDRDVLMSLWQVMAFLAAHYGDNSVAEQAWMRETNSDEIGSIMAVDWAWAPLMSSFRQSAVFKQLILTSGLNTFWSSFAYPAFCRPKGEHDFECD